MSHYNMCFNFFLFLKELVQYISSSSEGIRVSENALYLPPDLVASPTSTLRSTNGEDEPKPGEINNPAYSSVMFSTPNYDSVIYDTLSGSQNNLLETEEVPESANLYTPDPTDPYHVEDGMNIDAQMSLEKKTLSQIANGESPYEAVADSQNNNLYETIPAVHDLHSKST